MDLPLSEENGTHLLIDSGTKIILEAESDHSYESSSCDREISFKGNISSPNILDKAFSIEETDLAVPLEPVHVDTYPIPSNNGTTTDDSSSDISAKSDEDDGYVEEIIEEDSNTELEENYAMDNLIVNEDNGTCYCEEKELFKDIVTSNTISKKKDFSLDGLDTIPENIQETEISTGTIDQISLPTLTSILRGRPSRYESSYDICLGSSHKVSFPSDNSLLVSYWEPIYEFPWVISSEMSAEEILRVYQESCKKHKTIELDNITSQIAEIKNNTNHSATLKLHGVRITSEVNETFEDLLKVTNFHKIILNDCTFSSETMNEFLNMLEFYESVCHFEIEMNFDDQDTWICFCSACSNIEVLESLSFKKMVINEAYMRALLNAVKYNSNITMLNFDSCILDKLPAFYLVDNLITNRTIRELYLSSTGLYTKEAEVLARFLMHNTHLKVLDIGNNFIGDRGLESLSKGLCKQNTPGVGLSALSVFNNQLTEKSGPIINAILCECKNLHTLNIGYNSLTDQVLNFISLGLPSTTSLEGLGLQCTLLTCKGIDVLAEAIPQNKSLQKINLKGNKAIQINGVEKLCHALTNSKINKIEIDETNRYCNDPEAYNQLVKKLFAICTVNKSFVDSTDSEEIMNISQLMSRKMSLSCEPKYTIPEPAMSFTVGSPRLSPIPSPVSSPAPKSRFHIVKVIEPGSSGSSSNVSPSPSPKPKSRFLVTKVPPSPDEEVLVGHFANVRSSVSSNDSMDSLTTVHLDTDSD